MRQRDPPAKVACVGCFQERPGLKQARAARRRAVRVDDPLRYACEQIGRCGECEARDL